jgi:hypothetical protein
MIDRCCEAWLIDLEGGEVYCMPTAGSLTCLEKRKRSRIFADFLILLVNDLITRGKCSR